MLSESFFGCHYDGGTPFGGVCHRGDDTLGLERLEFCFQFFSVCIGNSSWCFHTEWFGLFCKFNVEAFSLHCFDAIFKYCRELIDEGGLFWLCWPIAGLNCFDCWQGVVLW